MRRRRAQQLGEAAVTWAAVSLADKLDTVVGMFYAGEKPTGSRDPFGLRRQAHGIFKILVDLPTLTGLTARPTLDALLDEGGEARSRRSSEWPAESRQAMDAFLLDRYRYVLEQRGFDVRNVRAVLQETRFAQLSPADALKRLEVLPEFTASPDFQKLAVAFKRVKNIARELPDDDYTVGRHERAAARDSCSRNRRKLRCCKSSSGAAPQLTACWNRGKICAAHLSRQPSSVLQSIDSSPKSL